MKLVTTLQNIKENTDPNKTIWNELLENMGQDLDNPDLATEVSLGFILENNGIHDAISSTSCFPDLKTSIRWYVVWCAEQVRYLMTDKRFTKVLDLTKRYLHGEATYKKLESAITASEKATASLGFELANQSAVLAARAACCSYYIVYAACSAIMSGLDEEKREAQTKEFLRLIDCYENGVEYTI